MPFGEVCLARNHSEDRTKLNMRWMRGVFVGKLDRTDEFLLLTPTGAMKTRCFKRLEGDNAWDLQFLNLQSVCWQSVECDSKEHAAETNIPKEGRVGKRQTGENSVLATEHVEQVRTYCRMRRLCWKWAAHRGVPSTN